MTERTKLLLAVIIVSAITAAAIGFALNPWRARGATILPTASTDTIGTFRTNVNTSLANLNAALGSTVGTSSPFTIGQLLYATSPSTTASVATTSVVCAGTVSCTTFAAIGPAPITITGSGISGSGTIGQLAYWNTSSALTNIGTSTGACSGGASCSSFTVVGAVAPTISVFGYPFVGNGTSTPLTYTGLQTFSFASSTQFSAGSSNTFYIDGNGKVTTCDTTNNWCGRLSPTRYLVIPFATSTPTWTATGTPPLSVAPDTVAPFAGVIRAIRCNVNTFLGIRLTINGTPVSLTYFIASSTPGQMLIAGSNTFALGDRIGLNAGTSTTAVGSSAISGSCTLETTET